MLGQLSTNIKRIISTILVITYLFFLMDKIGFGISFVKSAYLLWAASLLTILWLFLVKSFFLKTMVQTRVVMALYQERLHIVGSQFNGRVSLLFPKNLLVVFLFAIFFYILIDIFSANPTKDMTTLLLTIAWILAVQISGFDGRITLLGGLIFFIFTPFFVIFQKELNAEKASIWAYMFFVGGVMQEILFSRKSLNNLTTDKLLNFIFSLKQLIAAVSSSFRKVTIIDELPEKDTVTIREDEPFGKENKVDDSKPDSLELRDEQSEKGHKEMERKLEEKIHSPSVVSIDKERNGEFIKKVLLIKKMAMKVFNSLSEKDKMFFGARYIKLIKSVEVEMTGLFGRVDDKNDLFTQYYKIKSSLYELIFLTSMMDKYQIVNPELLSKLIKLLNEEIVKLDSFTS